MVESSIGKALSGEHYERMIAHADIVPVMSKQARKLAIGNVRDFPSDPMVTYMSKHAEEIFEPKRVLTDGDWLKSYREPDQRFDYYKQGKGNIKWVSPTKDKIYLFIADDSFTDEQIKQYQMYASAFFLGITSVEILRAGDALPNQNKRRTTQSKIPADYLDREVENRVGWTGEKQYRTCGTGGILTTLPKYRPQDNYAMLCITMRDLYPGPKWNFCFGWASFTEGVGAFSFHRYDPAFDGIEDPDREKNLLMRGCHIMCHEIGHQFGLRHCIYYECLMNGLMSAEEQRQGGIKILCPVCQKKLKQNLKFDSTERFQRLLIACDKLGFEEEAGVYRKLLRDAGQSEQLSPEAVSRESRQTRGASRSPPSRRGAQRATSNDVRLTTSSNANRLVGVINKPVAKLWR